MSNSRYFQKIGGVAGITQGAAYLVAMFFFFVLLSDTLNADPGQYMAFVAHNHVLMRIWILIAYWLTAGTTVVLALAIKERLKDGAPALTQVATVFAFIWAGLCIGSANLMIYDFGVVADLIGKDPTQAATVWSGLEAVENGITSGNEIIGSLWVLLLSIAALRTGALTRGVTYLGTAVSSAGLFTSLLSFVIPETQDFIRVFGLGMVPWSIWIGIVMLRTGPKLVRGSLPIPVPE